GAITWNVPPPVWLKAVGLSNEFSVVVVVSPQLMIAVYSAVAVDTCVASKVPVGLPGSVNVPMTVLAGVDCASLMVASGLGVPELRLTTTAASATVAGVSWTGFQSM